MPLFLVTNKYFFLTRQNETYITTTTSQLAQEVLEQEAKKVYNEQQKACECLKQQKLHVDA